MNEVVEEGLKGISAFELVCWILAGIAVITAIVAATIKIYKVVEKYRRVRNEHEKKVNMLEKHEVDIEELKVTDQKISNTLDTLTQKVDNLTNKLTEMQTNTDLQRRNTLKDRIRQSYGVYHERQTISTMEKEALEGLIEAYENAGGSNSFVHSVVEKEMYTWTIIP